MGAARAECQTTYAVLSGLSETKWNKNAVGSKRSGEVIKSLYFPKSKIWKL